MFFKIILNTKTNCFKWQLDDFTFEVPITVFTEMVHYIEKTQLGDSPISLPQIEIYKKNEKYKICLTDVLQMDDGQNRTNVVFRNKNNTKAFVIDKNGCYNWANYIRAVRYNQPELTKENERLEEND